MQTGRQVRYARYLTLAVLVAGALLLPTGARAQPCQHGASIFKTCESVKRTCASNIDCDDGIECTNDVCDQSISNTINCTISLAHADTCGDTTKINEAFDIDDFGGDNVRTPAVGNLPISGIFGNAVCCAGPTLPCFVGPAGSLFVVPNSVSGCGNLPLPGAAAAGQVTFVSNTYVIQPDDPDPLPNQGNVRVQDLCNAGASGCSTGVNTVQFTAATDLVTGCINTPKPDSTPCTDTDGDSCTNAGCNAVGSCDQAHLTTVCNPDSNPCTDDLACNPQTGLCEHPPVPDSTPCPDTDGNLCTNAGCEAGQCAQGHLTTVCNPDANPCTSDPACNPQTGLCDHPPVPDSTPCPDTDANLCTTAGCEAGQCVQPHVTTVCNPDSNECTLDPPCNPATGQCEHPPTPDSTPCTDTDANQCSVAGCEAGQCVQTHLNACPPPIDHFQCYEVKPATFTTRTVTVQDQFGTLTETLRFPHRLCNPTNKNNEGILDPTDHLAGYTAKATSAFTKQTNQTVVDQFGTLVLDVTRPDILLIPSSKDGVAQTPPLDHFQCYKVKRSRGAAKFAKRTVTIANQFESATLTLVKPARLCAPASKNNEDPTAPLHADHLTCYKVKGPRFVGSSHTITNQFDVNDTLQIIHRRELCVPSLKNPGSTTTTTTSTTTTTVMSPSGAFLDDRP